MTRPDTTTTSFDAKDLANRLLAASGGCLRLVGVSPNVVTRSLRDIRAGLGTSADAVVFDARVDHSFATLVQQHLLRLDQSTGLTPRVMRLAEAVESMEAEARAVRFDAVARLWTEMVRLHPAFLIVVEPGSASVEDRDLIRHFAQYVYSDPLQALTPEGAWEKPPGAMVFVGDVATVPVDETIDLSERAAAAIREYLASDAVVSAFMSGMGGDVSRLDDFVTRLAEGPQHLALYRAEHLDDLQRSMLDTLAVAAVPVSPDVLHDATALLGGAEYFAKSLRALESAGLVRKSMGDGQILVGMEDVELARALVDRLSDDRRRATHRSLADAERVRNESDPDVGFLARHYIASEDVELAIEFGVRAASRWEAAREYAKAREVVEGLLPLVDDQTRPGLELKLSSILEHLGEYQKALDACILAGVAHGEGSIRRGRLLTRLGRFEDARSAFGEALDDGSDRIRRDAVLGVADAAYALGNHDDAVALLEKMLADLGDSDLEASVRDRAVLAARNTLGKIAMVRNEFSRAVELYEENRELAAQWGWEAEVARAQANLGVVALQRDDFAEALERLEFALDESAARGSLPRAYCLLNIAAVHQRRGDFGAALDNCFEAMRCARKVGDQAAYTVAARNLATVYQDLGAYDRAWAIVDHLREEYENTPVTLAGGWNLFVRGHLLHETGRLDEALDVFEELLDGGARAVFGTQSTIRLAEIHAELGHLERARELLDSVDDRLDARAKHRALADLLEARLVLADDPASAVEAARDCYRSLTEAGMKNEPVRAQLLVADGLVALGREGEATSELQRALGRLREVARSVPPEFADSFWSKSINKKLVSRLQELGGEVPGECICDEVVAEAETVEVDRVALHQSPQFLQWRQRYEEIVGEDPQLHHVFRIIDRVASASASVLIYGESGTGKELVASALHRRSNRTGKPFVKVNCAAFVENLLLSELFGHEKGAFTGANEQKIGRFERADGGTIFLDEIGDISPNTQVALLRVLQEGTFERVGGNSTQKVDVRVVCATNKNLEEMVQRGEFRLDLYYRLKGVVIEMPALRDRRADIPRLARHFTEQFSAEKPRAFTDDALQFLASYSWPGNVRELQNFVRSALLFVDGPSIAMSDIDEFREFFVSGTVDSSLPPVDIDVEVDVATLPANTRPQAVGEWRAIDPEDALVESIVAEGRSLADIKKKLEIECIKRALIETGGNITQAADILQMKRPRLSQIINGDDELSELKNRLAG